MVPAGRRPIPWFALALVACDGALDLPSPPSDAQRPPRVDALSPLADFVGRVVTIQGDFPEATAAETTVRFGTGRETPILALAADASSLTVVVPDDAVDGPVTVRTPGGLDASEASFDVYGPGRVRAGATVESLDRRVDVGLVASLDDGSPRVALTLHQSIALLDESHGLAWIEPPRFDTLTLLDGADGWLFATGVVASDSCNGPLVLRGRPGDAGLEEVELRCLAGTWSADTTPYVLRASPDGTRAFVAGYSDADGDQPGVLVGFGSATPFAVADPPDHTGFTGACWASAGRLFLTDSESLHQLEIEGNQAIYDTFTLPDDLLGHVTFDCAGSRGITGGLTATLLDLSSWPPTVRAGPALPSGYPSVALSADGAAFAAAGSGVGEELRVYAIDDTAVVPLARHTLTTAGLPIPLSDGTFAIGDRGRVLFVSSRTGNDVEVAPIPTRPTTLGALTLGGDVKENYELALNLAGTAEVERFPVGASLGTPTVDPLVPGALRRPGVYPELLSSHDLTLRYRRDRKLFEVDEGLVCTPALPGPLAREVHSSSDGAVVAGVVPIDTSSSTIVLLDTSGPWCGVERKTLGFPAHADEVVARAGRLFVGAGNRLHALDLAEALLGRLTERWHLDLPEGEAVHAIDADDTTVVFTTWDPTSRLVPMTLHLTSASDPAAPVRRFPLGPLDLSAGGARALLLAPDGRQLWLRAADRISAFELDGDILRRTHTLATPSRSFDFLLSPDGETLFFTPGEEDLLHVVR